jgi:hypothetical protein
MSASCRATQKPDIVVQYGKSEGLWFGGQADLSCAGWIGFELSVRPLGSLLIGTPDSGLSRSEKLTNRLPAAGGSRDSTRSPPPISAKWEY